MLSILQDILCAILGLAVGVVNVAIAAINATIAAIALLIEGLFVLLPAIPEAPALPGGEAVELVGFIVPIEAVLTMVAGLLGIFLAFLGFRVIFNWLKAL